MTRMLIAGMVVGVCCTAYAGGNPDVRIYIDFDPPNYIHDIAPPLYTMIDAYICVDRLDEGFLSVSFDMEDPSVACPGAVAAPTWSVLLPGLILPPPAPWSSPGGVTLASAQCVVGESVPLAKVSMFYLGGSCCIEILDHELYARCVGDCIEPLEVDEYCVLAHGSIGGASCPDGDCTQVLVRPSAWGLMKGLYR